jgi:hypothetical protein
LARTWVRKSVYKPTRPFETSPRLRPSRILLRPQTENVFAGPFDTLKNRLHVFVQVAF